MRTAFDFMLNLDEGKIKNDGITRKDQFSVAINKALIEIRTYIIENNRYLRIDLSTGIPDLQNYADAVIRNFMLLGSNLERM